MNEHVTSWLSAYHDGELSGRRLRQVETHLETCAQCKARLEEIRSLSGLLQESPPVEGLLPSEIFVAQVGMRLPRENNVPLLKKVSESGWRAVPFGLLASWALVQTIFVVSNLVFLALRFIPGADQIMTLLPSGGSTPSVLSSLGGLGILRAGQFGANLLGSRGLLGWSFFLNVGLTLLIGLLYWSWLASWWIRKTNGNQMLNEAS